MASNSGTSALTPAAIDALSRGKLHDIRTPGLMIEVLKSGKKVWKYERRLVAVGVPIRLTFGRFPARTLAAAREWAAAINEQVEAGIDPRVAKRAEEERLRAEKARNEMTVARAHALYMAAVHEGRASRAKRKNKPRTIKDKLDIYRCDIAPELASKSIHLVTERDLIELVIKKGKTAKVRANRLAGELKVFFGWAAGLRGLEVGLEVDPSRRLGDLRFSEMPRQRKLSLEEIGWFLKAVAHEERDFRRGMLVWLLTAVRISEMIWARADELNEGVWTIPGERTKNRVPHAIALGPWGRALMTTDVEWVFPAERVAGPRRAGWYKARDRVLARMSEFAGRQIETFTPHDFRRTARSNTKRMRIDFETAEAMLNHVKTGLARIYDGYQLEDEKAAWFLAWENEIAGIARKLGVADALEVPSLVAKRHAALAIDAPALGDMLRPHHITKPLVVTPSAENCDAKLSHFSAAALRGAADSDFGIVQLRRCEGQGAGELGH
ncbi:MAG: integrase arm-type DNA-binding domain-containing protein [Sphingomonas sp.]|uniref:tyrosine-type recombinase/integrase n=1 Tax=Sphingomonas sp. TaxID=28214 RepID=UPI001B14EE54|nr:integrase arm-type DNA-binding domain-containing protein [Sphingomonas sp.]MBO9623982.1 integrase arm-type DNA-binding domain-containing protein [Sphingomonas sp.]